MKKIEIKSLKLNKNLISTLQSNNVNGGGGSFDTLVACSAKTYCVSKCICDPNPPSDPTNDISTLPVTCNN
ncbi:hypothetical protein [Kordia sp.]|uniref:hypothetical protein n=1 Tax=Kordia sp. TaxID=1965332 RepID=UPI003D6AEB2A